jgi:hypothetical protein
MNDIMAALPEVIDARVRKILKENAEGARPMAEMLRPWYAADQAARRQRQDEQD